MVSLNGKCITPSKIFVNEPIVYYDGVQLALAKENDRNFFCINIGSDDNMPEQFLAIGSEKFLVVELSNEDYNKFQSRETSTLDLIKDDSKYFIGYSVYDKEGLFIVNIETLPLDKVNKEWLPGTAFYHNKQK
jgi:hypothetical protein